MRVLWFLVFVSNVVAVAFGDTASSEYQRGTIIAVTRHNNAPNHSGTTEYEVSVQIRNTIYVVLYAPPNGANSVEYAAGIDILVLVGQHELTFPSKLSGTAVVPILRKETVRDRSTLDWSKAPSQYFSMKMENLSANLKLTDEQKAALRPIAEQEAVEAGQVCFTTVIPRKERLKQWGKIVRSSDAKLKPILSPAQWDKLLAMRKQQTLELKQLIADRHN